MKDTINHELFHRSVRVSAPATVANVGSGFDAMGFALEQPEDILSLRLLDEPGIRILNHTPYEMSLDPMLNTAGKGVHELLQSTGKDSLGVEIIIEKKIAPGSGIGSSAASAVASVVGVNHLLGEPYSREALLHFCLTGEEAASLSRHADNVAPALLGGFCLVEGEEIRPLHIPDFLYACVVHPALEIKTSEARKVLKKEISLAEGVKQWTRLGTLVAGLYESNADWIAKGMEDELIEPQRGPLIRGFYEVKQAACKAGALHCTISGAGPSVFAFCKGKQNALEVGTSMKRIFEGLGISSDVYVSKPGASGARILSEE